MAFWCIVLQVYMLVSSDLAVPSYAQFGTSSDEMSLSQWVSQVMHVSSDLVVPSYAQFENSLDEMCVSQWVAQDKSPKQVRY
jgi:hypothetical protein